LVESLCQIDINRIQSENAKWKEKILQEKIESLKLLSLLNSLNSELDEKKGKTTTTTSTKAMDMKDDTISSTMLTEHLNNED
jgi:hypothetical protein